MSMNKVNMSLDEIINNTRKNKRPMQVIKGRGGFNRKERNFQNRRNFNSRNENGRGRFQGRGATRTRGRFTAFKRYNNFETRENTEISKVVLNKLRNSQ